MRIILFILLSFTAYSQDKVMRLHKNTPDSLILVKYQHSKTIRVTDGLVYKYTIPDLDTARFFEALDGEYESVTTFRKKGATPDPEPTLQGPFKTLNIPGTIQAEDYNKGGQGIAFNDVDKLNSGTNKMYRADNVDLEGTSLINLGWNYTGDWYEYTVNVTKSGNYRFDFRVAALDPGGALNLQAEGWKTIGTVNIPDTNGWQTYQTVSFTSSLTAGKKLLRLNIVNGAFNIDSFTVTEQ